MTVGELMNLLKDIPPDLPVVIVQKVKTGYDAGDVYHSIDMSISPQPTTLPTRVYLKAEGLRLAGGW